jgi:IS605 OrfB family transposase
LDQEYSNLQKFLQGNVEVKLYSANKQQAKRFYKKIKGDKEYPLSIRKDLLKIEKHATKIAQFWARIPVAGRRGGLWVAIKPHYKILPEHEICESKLLKRNGEYFLYITVEKGVEIEQPTDPDRIAVISIDIGERNPIAKTTMVNGNTKCEFLGKQLRSIHSHYNHWRKSIGARKVKGGLRKIKFIGDKEFRKSNDLIHKITRRVVAEAKELRAKGYQPIIVVGDLKVRKPRMKGKVRRRKNNRKIHQMTSHRIKHYLTYKANCGGIPVEKTDESWTSRTCHPCGSIGKRVKRLFRCGSCGLEYNADLNASRNVGIRFLDQWLRNRALSEQAQNQGIETATPNLDGLTNQQATLEAPPFRVG